MTQLLFSFQELVTEIDAFARRHRYHPLEALPWVAALACALAFPDYLPLGAQILATILFDSETSVT